MPRPVSSGGVIVRRRAGAYRVCLIIRRQDHRRVWALPKGHVEPGETLEAAALREVQEETGLQGAVIAKLGEIAYTFSAPDRGRTVRYAKTVHFYLLRYRRGSTRLHDGEVEEAVWMPLDDALTRLTYPNERRMLRKARRTLLAA